MIGLGLVLNAPTLLGAEFDPKTPPSKPEWQHFHKMTDAELTKLWVFQTQRGHKKLADWSWQWRMGWMQRCGTSEMNSICPQILLEGLADNAMVIRAEAATRIGKRFAGTATPEILRALEKAYKDPRNSRNGNPLFVYERILEALSNLKDVRATKIASRLASKHPDTTAYWARIQKK